MRGFDSASPSHQATSPAVARAPVSRASGLIYQVFPEQMRARGMIWRSAKNKQKHSEQDGVPSVELGTAKVVVAEPKCGSEYAVGWGYTQELSFIWAESEAVYAP